MNPFRWLVSASAICQLIGGALVLWGLKVVPASNPFNSVVRDSPEKAVMGLTLLLVAGVASR